MNTKQRQDDRSYRSSKRSRGLQPSQVIGVTKRFASALLSNDEDVLDKMTLYSAGSIGGQGSNISSLRKTGSTRVLSVLCSGKQSTVIFGDDKGPSCIGLFNVIDPSHVMGDWQVFQKI